MMQQKSGASDTPLLAADERVHSPARPWRLLPLLLLGITLLIGLLSWHTTSKEADDQVTMLYEKHDYAQNLSYLPDLTRTRLVKQPFKLPSTVEAANLLFTTLRIENAEAIFATISMVDIEVLFKDFLATIGSTAGQRTDNRKAHYDTAQEYALRLGVFAENVAEILSKNALEQAHATRPDHARFGISTFADWTAEEFSKLLMKPEHAEEGEEAQLSHPFDEGNKEVGNAMTPSNDIPCSGGFKFMPRQQGQCGSCYAYSSAQTLRYTVMWTTKQDPGTLSTQYIKDCWPSAQGRTCEDGVDGCCGGWPQMVLNWAASQGGLPSKQAYPDAPDSESHEHHACKTRPKAATLKKAYRVVKNANSEKTMAKDFCAYGAMSIAVQANALQHYISGVMSKAGCNVGPTNHAVELVGVDANSKLWIVKNSWGLYWGVSPYYPYPRAGHGGRKWAGHVLIEWGTGACDVNGHAVYITGSQKL